MIDEYLKVWLLEVNPSPSLDYQELPLMKKLSESLLTDLPTVVVDKKTS
jgi:D-alanine-D-alanine ligase-like ATP-grasp enzyme